MSKAETANLATLRAEREAIDQQIADLTSRRSDIEDQADEELGTFLDRMKALIEGAFGGEQKPKRTKRAKAPVSE